MAGDRAASFVEHHHVAGQALVFCAQTVDGPCAEGRPPDERAAGVHGNQRRAVRMAVGVARLEHRQLVGVPADIRKIIGDEQTALASRAEGPPVRREEADAAAAGVDVFFVLRQRLVGVLLQLRLVVERVQLAGAAVHHQENAVLGFAEVVGAAGLEWPGFRLAKRLGVTRKKTVYPQQRRQCQSREPGPHLPHKLAAGLSTWENLTRWVGDTLGHGSTVSFSGKLTPTRG